MERIAVPDVIPSARVPVDWQGLRAQLAPLWRHAVWATLLFGALLVSVAIRVEVQHLRQDLDRNARVLREARVVQDRLALELLARRRAQVLDRAADQLALSQPAVVERVRP